MTQPWKPLGIYYLANLRSSMIIIDHLIKGVGKVFLIFLRSMQSEEGTIPTPCRRPWWSGVPLLSGVSYPNHSVDTHITLKKVVIYRTDKPWFRRRLLHTSVSCGIFPNAVIQKYLLASWGSTNNIL